jgi:hypothetical protein
VLVLQSIVESDHWLVRVCIVDCQDGELLCLTIVVPSWRDDDLLSCLPVYWLKDGDLVVSDVCRGLHLTPSRVPGDSVEVSNAVVCRDDFVSEDWKLGISSL